MKMVYLHKQNFYNYFKTNDGTMTLIPMFKYCYSPSYLMAKYMKYTTVTMKYDFENFFREVLNKTRNH